MLRGVHLGGTLVRLVAWVRAPWSDMVARRGACCLVVALQKNRQGSPPLLRGV